MSADGDRRRKIWKGMRAKSMLALLLALLLVFFVNTPPVMAEEEGEENVSVETTVSDPGDPGPLRGAEDSGGDSGSDSGEEPEEEQETVPLETAPGSATVSEVVEV
ncbi:MAG: hypothetical protein J5744_01355, partial [Oscillospiraceae bacterium]|nr:hypothetical protein [Oscillospiraceae bacterium]